MEIDCLIMVQAIRRSTTLLSCLGRIVEDYKKLLSDQKDRNVFFVFVKQSANHVSHYLAEI